MENQYQRWVNLSYVLLGAAIGYLVFAVSHKAIATFDLETRIKNVDLVVQIGSVVVAGLVFLILNRHPKINPFMNEVAGELSRVTWPTQKDTTSATVVVILMVIISGMFLGMLDYIWTQLLRWVL